MKLAILTANLGNFDTPVEVFDQMVVPAEVDKLIFKSFTDIDFPPITGMTPRMQYRIPKMFGWQMFPGYDIYIWHDSSMLLQHHESVDWFLDKLGNADMAFFRHPWRKTIKEEVDHIEEYLQKGNEYITSRYKNGLHKEQYAEIVQDYDYTDDLLLTSTAFIYRNNEKSQEVLEAWWFYQSRYFTVDQIVLPYILRKVEDLKFNIIEENQFKTPYITLVSHHK